MSKANSKAKYITSTPKMSPYLLEVLVTNLSNGFDKIFVTHFVNPLVTNPIPTLIKKPSSNLMSRGRDT